MKRPNNHKHKLPARPIDPAEAWAEMVNDKCAMAMVKWLKGSVFLSRPIASLKLTEVKALAAVACHTWIIEASHRVKVEPDPEHKAKLKTLLS